ncbi:hypothetical protein NHQ30_000770 [Ciborinia camelliae]|nr:hypothetical protein NHQ30_000770 [Ciborinia camelliae]
MTEVHSIASFRGLIPIRYLPTLAYSNPPPPTPANTQVLLIQFPGQGGGAYWGLPNGEERCHGPQKNIVSAVSQRLETDASLKVEFQHILNLGSAGRTGDIEGQDDAKKWDGSVLLKYKSCDSKRERVVRRWLALVKTEEKNKEAQEKEVAKYKWCSWEEAVEHLAFDEAKDMYEAKDMLKRALAMFEAYGKVDGEAQAQVCSGDWK